MLRRIRQRQCREMTPARVDEIEVDLIADEDDVVATRQLHDALKFLTAVEMTGRVVGTAQKQDPGTRFPLEQRFQVVQL